MNYKQELDSAFSLYVRLRDADDNGMIRCISCDKVMPFNRFDAGHYFSRSHIATRWHEDNVHAQCTICNRNLYGNIEAYRNNLIFKIGRKRFEELERLHNTIDHEPTEEEYKELIRGYRECCRKLARLKGIKIV